MTLPKRYDRRGLEGHPPRRIRKNSASCLGLRNGFIDGDSLQRGLADRQRCGFTFRLHPGTAATYGPVMVEPYREPVISATSPTEIVWAAWFIRSPRAGNLHPESALLHLFHNAPCILDLSRE